MAWNVAAYGERGRPAGLSDAAFFSTRGDLLANGQARLVGSHDTANVFYAALEVVGDEHRLPVGSVYAVVISKSRTRHEFSWKEEGEHENPEPHYVPLDFIALLTPTEDLYANIWRNLASDFAKRAVAAKGDIITLARPHHFSDGARRDHFEVLTHGQLLSLDDGRTVRLDDWREREYTIERTAADASVSATLFDLDAPAA